jgi:hypothetical protein
MSIGAVQGAALLGSVNTLHSSFPDNAEVEYETQGRKLDYVASC